MGKRSRHAGCTLSCSRDSICSFYSSLIWHLLTPSGRCLLAHCCLLEMLHWRTGPGLGHIERRSDLGVQVRSRRERVARVQAALETDSEQDDRQVYVRAPVEEVSGPGDPRSAPQDPRDNQRQSHRASVHAVFQVHAGAYIPMPSIEAHCDFKLRLLTARYDLLVVHRPAHLICSSRSTPTES